MDREDSDDERRLISNYIRNPPADVKKSLDRMLERVKSRCGPVPKHLRNGDFLQKRKISIAQLRTLAFQGAKHMHFACDLMQQSQYKQALTEMDRISPQCFELAHEVCMNKCYCWRRLKCYNNALDEALKCLLIDDRNPDGLMLSALLLSRKKRFFEAEYCMQQAKTHTPAGKMLTVYDIRLCMKANMMQAITESGYEEDVALAASDLYRSLSHVSTELTSGEAFRMKHYFSSCCPKEPSF